MSGSGEIDQTYGDRGIYRIVDGPPTTVRIIVENSGRVITAAEMGEFYRLARAAEDYLEAIRPNTLADEVRDRMHDGTETDVPDNRSTE